MTKTKLSGGKFLLIINHDHIAKVMKVRKQVFNHDATVSRAAA